jgi:hypothetical protein
MQRLESLRERRLDRERRLIGKRDTVEGIAGEYGITPQDALKQIRDQGAERLRPGQILDFERPATGAGLIGLGPQLVARGLEGGPGERIANFVKTILQKREDPTPLAPRPFVTEETRQPLFPDTTAFEDLFEGGPEGPVDTRDPEYVAKLAEIGAASDVWNMPSEELYGLSPRQSTALATKWTGEAVHYWAQTGDENARPTIITQDIFDQFPETYQMIVRDYMGYRQDAEGDWRRIDFPEESYGMGGYGYGDYAFPAFGGGDYEYLSRGGQRFRRHGGGKSRGQVRQIYAGGIAPAHWRIG